jgi:short subunit dehydrogenase-like uncharacterized protein
MNDPSKTPEAIPPNSREWDVVLLGATGFTGQLTAGYLAEAARSRTFSWAIAGRSPSKLEQIQKRLSLNSKANSLPGCIHADITDPRSLRLMAERTRVVINTVGPFLEHGEQVVKACVEAGTHYIDLTGEPEFVDTMRHYYDEVAQKKHLKIIHSCGFDSIPHDLGALFTIHRLNQLLGEERSGKVPVTLEGFVTASGHFSGGTWHSAITQFGRLREYQRKKSAWRRDLPPIKGARHINGVIPRLKYMPEFSAWACPFPTIDPQVIKRTARQNPDYGPDFRYGHYVLIKHLPIVAGAALGGGAVIALSQMKPTRDLLLKLRDPGEGPDEHQRQKAWFKVRMIARAEGLAVWTCISGGDPGYGETAKMLAESALCLALEAEALPQNFGVTTPALGMGDRLIERLQAAGIRFEALS